MACVLREDRLLINCYWNCLDSPICLLFLSGSLEDRETRLSSSLHYEERKTVTRQDTSKNSVLNFSEKPADKMREKAVHGKFTGILTMAFIVTIAFDSKSPTSYPTSKNSLSQKIVLFIVVQ